MNSSNTEIMWKSMFIDLKEECKLCGMPVGIYLVNYDQGLKMCSNKRCEWPITEEEIEIFSFGDMQFKSTNIEGPCTDVDLEEIKKLSMCIKGPSKPKQLGSSTKVQKGKTTKMMDMEKSDKQSNAITNKVYKQENKVNLGKQENVEEEDSNHVFVVKENNYEIIDSLDNIIEYDGKEKIISKESEDVKKQERDIEVDVNQQTLAMESDPEVKESDKDIFEKPLPIDDELYIDKCLEKARAKIATSAPFKSKTNITNPWLLKRLYITQSSKTKRIKKVSVPHEHVLPKMQVYDDEIIRKPTTEIPKIHVKINTDSSSGPAITIQFDDVETASGSSINDETTNTKIYVNKQQD